MSKTRATSKVAAAPLKHKIGLDRQISQGSQHIKKKKLNKKDAKKSSDGSKNQISDKLARKILKEAKEQQKEILKEEKEFEFSDLSEEEEEKEVEAKKAVNINKSTILNEDDDSDNHSSMAEDDSYSDYEVDENVDISESEASILGKFGMGPAAKTTSTVNLSEMILKKISSNTTEPKSNLNPKVLDVYGNKVALVLNRYKSGKLPKAFKMIPSLRNWEEILFLTKPHEWSPNAVFAGTKLFVSNLKPKEATKFVNAVLLEHFRADIESSKKLNVHIYNAIKRSLYKPAAFFKGILFPLAASFENRPTTLKEAVVIASILKKCSIPLVHSAAALLRLAQISMSHQNLRVNSAVLQYSGPVSLWIKALLDKKYALFYRVIDELVLYFKSFNISNAKIQSSDGSFMDHLPVLWQQSLLVFVQRYKEDLTKEQKKDIIAVASLHQHESISNEIIRELNQTKSREDKESAMDI